MCVVPDNPLKTLNPMKVLKNPGKTLNPFNSMKTVNPLEVIKNPTKAGTSALPG